MVHARIPSSQELGPMTVFELLSETLSQKKKGEEQGQMRWRTEKERGREGSGLEKEREGWKGQEGFVWFGLVFLRQGLCVVLDVLLLAEYTRLALSSEILLPRPLHSQC